jgi:metallo-beta-lactamase family protein
MSELQQAPECVYLIHGERPAQEALAQKIVDAYTWRVAIPKLHDVVSLAV